MIRQSFPSIFWPLRNSRYQYKHRSLTAMGLGHRIEMLQLAESLHPTPRIQLLERRQLFGVFELVPDLEEKMQSTAWSERWS